MRGGPTTRVYAGCSPQRIASAIETHSDAIRFLEWQGCSPQRIASAIETAYRWYQQVLAQVAPPKESPLRLKLFNTVIIKIKLVSCSPQRIASAIETAGRVLV